MYALDRLPKVSFVGDRLTVKSSDILDEYPYAEVRDIKYQGVTTTIDGIAADRVTHPLPFRRDGSKLVFKPGQEGTATLYAIDGRNVGSAVLNPAGSVTLDLGHLPSGIYLVKIGRVTYKIAVGL